MTLTLVKSPAHVATELPAAAEQVTLSIYKATYPADYAEGDRYDTDISEVTIARDDCISSVDYIREIVREFTTRGASFNFTGSDWAKSEPYQHPHSGEWEEISIHFQGDPDMDLVNMVVALVDAKDYR